MARKNPKRVKAGKKARRKTTAGVRKAARARWRR